MRHTLQRRALATLAAIGMALPALAASHGGGEERHAIAELVNADGEKVGTVRFVEPIGGQGVIVDAMIENLPPGTHAFHVHETGSCDAPDFKSAGGHFAPNGQAHGIRSAEGMHAGDLPNIHVPATGTLRDEMFALNLSLGDALFDSDGAAVVVHEGPDDYQTDPAGNAGPRIACGVITRP